MFRTPEDARAVFQSIERHMPEIAARARVRVEAERAAEDPAHPLHDMFRDLFGVFRR